MIENVVYFVDKADDQIVGSLAQMVEEMEDFQAIGSSTLTHNQWVADRFNFEEDDVTNINEILSQLSQSTTGKVLHMDYQVHETDFQYCISVVYHLTAMPQN